MTKTDRRSLATLLLALVLISSGCGDGGGGPTSPTAPVMPTAPVAPAPIPMVAGTYTGPFSFWLAGQLLGTFPTTMTVVQTNARVTISGIIEGGVVRWLPTSGTVDADGRYTLDPDTVVETESCGVMTITEFDVVFGDGTVRSQISQHSAECGTLRAEGNLVRSGS